MDRTAKITVACLIAYLFVGIVTFGHAAADEPQVCAPEDTYCTRSWLRGDAAFTGLGAAVFWPFYWSWEALS